VGAGELVKRAFGVYSTDSGAFDGPISTNIVRLHKNPNRVVPEMASVAKVGDAVS
jgi:hypothetical protein